MLRAMLTVGVLAACAALAQAPPAMAQPQDPPSDAPAPRKALTEWGTVPVLTQDDRLIRCGETIGDAACAWKRLRGGSFDDPAPFDVDSFFDMARRRGE